MGDLYGFAGQEGPRVIVRSILWLCLLGPLFFIGYGFTNWITSLRSDVPSFYFSWERSIPFLAWTIVPYWSVDFFYAASFFLRSTKEELDQHGLRILTAQLVSYAAFLLFPLRYDFARPETSGLYGWLFDRLLSFDRPFNLAPSMHVSLAVILMFRYRSKWVTALMLLACLSTLTTYQHHVIDLPAGAWVGLFSIWLIPQPPSTVRTPSDKLALLYLAGAAIFAFAGWWAWWAAGAWLLVAAIYAVGFHAAGGDGARDRRWRLARPSSSARPMVGGDGGLNRRAPRHPPPVRVPQHSDAGPGGSFARATASRGERRRGHASAHARVLRSGPLAQCNHGRRLAHRNQAREFG
jgi:hypothetical protein